MIFLRNMLFLAPIFVSVSAYSGPYEFRIAGAKSIYFDDKMIPSIQKNSDLQEPELIELVTEDEQKLVGHFHDRKSDTVIILGHGFNACKSKWIEQSVIHMFPGYDILTFDYRWNSMAGYILSLKTLTSPVDRLVFDGKKDLRSAVDFVRKRKNYRQVIGLGECHSAYLFVSSQAEARKQKRPLFDKLILDSCWLKISDFIDSLLVDPLLLLNTQTGYVPGVFKNILHWSPGINISRFFWSIITPSLSLTSDLKKLDVPVLFIYGKNDLLVSNSSFNTIWKITKSKQKAALITPYEHVGSYANVALYQYFCNEFIENEFDVFSGKISTSF